MSGMWRIGWVLVLLVMLPATARALQPVEVTSEENVTAWLVEDHTVPAFSLNVRLRHAGSANDPAGKEGLASLTAALLKEGAGERDSAAFHDALDFYAIRLSADVSRDDMNISLTSLSEHADMAFSLLHDMLADPHFAQPDVERLKSQQQAALLQAQGDAGYQAQKAFYETAFAGHAYAKPQEGTAETIAAIGVGDVLAYKASHLKRGEMTFSVTGDLSAARLKELLEKYMDPLPEGESLSPELDTVTPALAQEKAIRVDVPQTVVYFALPGIKREDASYYVAYIMNHLFGGSGLSSRLALEIREKRGLAYYATSDLADYDKAALLVGSFATRNDQAAQAIAALKEVVAAAGRDGFTQEEFDEAVSYLTGAFPARLTSNGSVTAYLDSMQRYHLGKEYLEKRNGYLEAVTLEEVNALAKTLFKPENLLIITAGNPAPTAPDTGEKQQ